MALRSDDWVNKVNPQLGLKRKAYPIIIHGIPTTFKPSSRAHVHELIKDNHGVLDSATRIVWAKKFSIEAGKPFSSLIIHLTDPAAANQAINNHVCFKHLLKVTEKLTKQVRQYYQCLDFGHLAKTCPESFRSCSHCAGAHPFEDCPKREEPICCVNCTQKFPEASFPGVATATTTDLTE